MDSPLRNWLLARLLAFGEEPTLEHVFWVPVAHGGLMLEPSIPQGLYPIDPTLKQRKSIKRKDLQR